MKTLVEWSQQAYIFDIGFELSLAHPGKTIYDRQILSIILIGDCPLTLHIRHTLSGPVVGTAFILITI